MSETIIIYLYLMGIVWSAVLLSDEGMRVREYGWLLLWPVLLLIVLVANKIVDMEYNKIFSKNK